MTSFISHFLFSFSVVFLPPGTEWWSECMLCLVLLNVYSLHNAEWMNVWNVNNNLPSNVRSRAPARFKSNWAMAGCNKNVSNAFQMGRSNVAGNGVGKYVACFDVNHRQDVCKWSLHSPNHSASRPTQLLHLGRYLTNFTRLLFHSHGIMITFK